MQMRLFSLFALAALLAAGSAPAAPFTVDPASVKIEVAVHATMHSFTGRLDQAAVALDGDPATGAINSADVSFAWTDLKTGDKGRDKEMLAWAGIGTNPRGRFLLTTLSRTADGKTTATGSLELNGQSHAITFPVKIDRSADGRLALSGEAKFDHRDWGLPKIRKFGLLTVDPVVIVSFALAARPGP